MCVLQAANIRSVIKRRRWQLALESDLFSGGGDGGDGWRATRFGSKMDVGGDGGLKPDPDRVDGRRWRSTATRRRSAVEVGGGPPSTK
ncbi:hypothetical protein U1Q18_046444 [Sarracenia purpurea var. burkii]